MKFLIKIEDLINKYLEIFFEALWKKICSLIPAKFKEQYYFKKDLYLNKLNAKIESLKTFKEKGITKSKTAKENVTEKINQIKAYPVKEKIEETKTFIKNDIKPNPYLFFKLKFDIVFNKTKEIIKKILTNKLKYLLRISAMSLIVFYVGSYFIESGVNEIDFKINDANRREIASVKKQQFEKELQYERPDYYKISTRSFKLGSINIPIIVQSIHSIRNINLDLNLTLSNRFTKMFIAAKEAQLVDHLISNVHATISSFPVENEGKVILTKKIKDEINLFLEFHNIDGHVEELDIVGMDVW